MTVEIHGGWFKAAATYEKFLVERKKIQVGLFIRILICSYENRRLELSVATADVINTSAHNIK